MGIRPEMIRHNRLGVLPTVGDDSGPGYAASKEQLDLVKPGGGIMEFVDQAGWADGDLQTGFL